MKFLTQKIVTKLSKIWVWDPGSGENLFRIPDAGVKKAPDPGSWTLETDIPESVGCRAVEQQAGADAAAEGGRGGGGGGPGGRVGNKKPTQNPPKKTHLKTH